MVSPQYTGWAIGAFTGDPYKDARLSFGTTALAGNKATVTVTGAIEVGVAVGTTNTGSASVRLNSTAAQLAAGSAIFAGDVATDTIHYFIVSSGKA